MPEGLAELAVSRRDIPIQNLYYLLSYAWDMLEEAKLANVSVTPEMRLQDLLARVLCGGVTHLLKRGLDRSYVTYAEEIAGVRGRLDIAASVKRNSFLKAQACCIFDELSPDTLHNRIVKTTLRQLGTVDNLAADLAEELRELYRRFPGVMETRISPQLFRRVSLGRNSSYYRFLLDVCELVQTNLLVDEASGDIQFRDFVRDEAQMARLFERFLLNFFKREQRQFKVDSPRFRWRASGSPEHLSYLPEMRTDIVLRDRTDTIVMDAKFYSETLSEYLTTRSVRSSHLYQIFAYMSHLAHGDRRDRVTGILVYPRVTETVRVGVTLFGHPMLAATVNLAQPWPGVRADLLSLLPP